MVYLTPQYPPEGEFVSYGLYVNETIKVTPAYSFFVLNVLNTLVSMCECHKTETLNLRI